MNLSNKIPNKYIIEGYVVYYDKPYIISKKESVYFNRLEIDESLNNDVRFIVNENWNHVIAREPNTLKLISDGIGLKYIAQISNTSFGKDTYELLKTNIMNGIGIPLNKNNRIIKSINGYSIKELRCISLYNDKIGNGNIKIYRKNIDLNKIIDDYNNIFSK